MTARNLPAYPAYMVPVQAPAIVIGKSAKALAGQCLVALDTANGRISNSSQWYGAVAANFAKGRN